MKTSHRIRVLLVFTIVSIVVAVGCEEEEGFTTDGGGVSFSGYVTDSVSGDPIDSAKVFASDTITGFPWYADSTGYYTAATFRSQLTVIVQKTGYRTKSRELELAGDTTNIDFELVPIP